MSNTSDGFEFSGGNSIPQNLHGRVGNSRHNDSLEKGRDICSLKRIINEILSDIVIGFLQVDFSRHPSPTLATLHIVNNFLGNDNVVGNVPSCNKPSLFWCNDFREDKLEVVSNYFYNQFVKNRAEVDGTKLGETFWVLNLGNEDNQGVIKASINSPPLKTFLT